MSIEPSSRRRRPTNNVPCVPTISRTLLHLVHPATHSAQSIRWASRSGGDGGRAAATTHSSKDQVYHTLPHPPTVYRHEQDQIVVDDLPSRVDGAETRQIQVQTS
ncbi:uncharacterized protein ColSpa_04634 [Colletotrichum spaethianum]|uniref:Uncharacterized protein n=1 Tax=Colletotrichum spaethianum TaxID=700344 RepID=A0AA37P146_9PEZI|nr:uncharacterized protein ColSpa_04634 [Colletotrichum spaethianum]GKT44453.1 hypothetical protein ColSpa_04634 [Colletotrichum spaethianum]